MIIRLAGIKKNSVVDGPGIRYSIYVQGCSHRCVGCHNPETHDPLGGYTLPTTELAAMVNDERWIDGVTISGGEPFEQAGPVVNLVKLLNNSDKLILYSGYTFEFLLAMGEINKDVKELLLAGWLLIDGPYLNEKKSLSIAYRGSLNQRIIDLSLSLEAKKAVTCDIVIS